MTNLIFDDEYIGQRFTYGVTLRPVARFNIPDGWIIDSQKQHPDFKRFGTIDYPERLPEDVANHYDLVLISGQN